MNLAFRRNATPTRHYHWLCLAEMEELYFSFSGYSADRKRWWNVDLSGSWKDASYELGRLAGFVLEEEGGSRTRRGSMGACQAQYGLRDFQDTVQTSNCKHGTKIRATPIPRQTQLTSIWKATSLSMSSLYNTQAWASWRTKHPCIRSVLRLYKRAKLLAGWHKVVCLCRGGANGRFEYANTATLLTW